MRRHNKTKKRAVVAGDSIEKLIFQQRFAVRFIIAISLVRFYFSLEKRDDLNKSDLSFTSEHIAWIRARLARTKGRFVRQDPEDVYFCATK